MNSQMPLIRMVFELAREEHPRLYDDLIRFPKGTKRINRLRTLAHDGLLLQMDMGRGLEAPGEIATVTRARALTSQIFDDPLSE
jgi:hypothetical protein